METTNAPMPPQMDNPEPIRSRSDILPRKEGPAVPQDLTVALTHDQTAALHELAAHWRENLEETLRRVAVDGPEMALRIIHHD